MKISDFSIHLRSGAGNGDPRDGLCLMQAVHWFSGADHHLSDGPECASPVLCAVGIQLNDTAPSQEHRDRLWPLVWQLLGSRDPSTEQARAEYIVREVAHRIIAPVFDKIGLRDHADALKRAQSMAEIETAARAAARAAEAASRAAETVSWAVSRAAEAVSWAAAAAWAAAWAASRAARAAAAEAEAASRAAARAAEAASRPAEAVSWAAAWEELCQIFVESIALGEHGNVDPIYMPRAMKLSHILQDL